MRRFIFQSDPVAARDMSDAPVGASPVPANETLSVDIERLFLITAALWTLLKEKHEYTDDDLVRRIEEIDALDGRIDGRIAKMERPDCPQCHRKQVGPLPVCLYCGAKVARDPFER
jgi:hypothetical protein